MSNDIWSIFSLKNLIKLYICSMIKMIAQVTLLCFSLTACIPNESEFEGYRKAQLQRLLSNQSVKSWTLENRLLAGEAVILEACESNHALLFKYTSSASDQDTLMYINQADSCYAVNDTTFGFWYVPSVLNPFDVTDTLVLVWNGVDTGFFLIDDINPEMLQIRTFLTDSLSEYFTAKEIAVE
ncbi:MAG: hypothetical protein ACI9XJ_000901 [Marivirga sp.]|jgi:hypothetical protein